MSAGTMSYPLRLDSRSTTRALLGALGVLLLVHIGLQVDRFYTHVTQWQIQALFDVDQEQSIPTWFSSAVLGLAALLLRALANERLRAGSPEARGWSAMSWVVLYLSFDEVGGLHETLNSLSPIMWTIPFGVLALLVAAAFVPFVIRLDRDTRAGIFVAGIVYIAGAVGVELLTSQFFGESNKRQLSYELITPFEEGLEMLGSVLLVRTVLRAMERADGAAVVAIEVTPQTTKAAPPGAAFE
jgi:hypothetical protein